MSKHVTAIYRSHAVAREVKEKVEALGIGLHHVTIVPDDDTPVADGTHRGDDHVNAIDRLNLPDDDQRTYKRAVRTGDYVVSVKVNGDDDIDRVEEAMRHPEHGYDIDRYDADYRAHPDYETDLERDRDMAAAEGRYSRDTTRNATHARTYY
jgi:hypothetical protein